MSKIKFPRNFKYFPTLVSDPNSGRPVIIMILEGKSVEPAIDRMMEFLIYVALILSAISIGATALHIDPKTGGRWSLIVN